MHAPGMQNETRAGCREFPCSVDGAGRGGYDVRHTASDTSKLPLRSAEFLRQTGFERVTNVEGGTLAWKRAGKALEHELAPTLPELR